MLRYGATLQNIQHHPNLGHLRQLQLRGQQVQVPNQHVDQHTNEVYGSLFTESSTNGTDLLILP